MNEKQPDQKPARAVLYRRISETDDEFDKVENQRQILRKFCHEQGYRVVGDYVDDGISAWRDDVTRPSWNRMLSDIPHGKFDVIVATFENRLTRQTLEKVELLGLCRASGVRWHTKHNGRVDPTMSDQSLLAIIKGWQAETEVSDRIKAQKERFDKERSNGKPLWGVRPFGFEKDRITHRESEAAELRWAYEQVDGGATIYSIIRDWNSRGVLTSTGKPWSYATVQQMLKRPRNVALMQVSRMEKGEDEKVRQVREIDYSIKCQWEPIVDRELWERVCDKVTKDPDDVRRQFEQRWLLSGIARCGVCSLPMRSSTGGGGRGKKGQPGYRCQRSALPAIPPDRRDDGTKVRHSTAVASDLDKLARNAVVSAFLLAPTSLLPANPKAKADLHRAQSELRAVRRQMRIVSETIGLPGFKTQELRARASRLAKKESELEQEIRTIRAEDANSAMVGRSRQAMMGDGGRVKFEKVSTAKEKLFKRFDALPLRHQRELVRNLLDVVVYPGRRPERFVVWHKVATSLNDENESPPTFLRPVQSAVSPGLAE